MQTPTDNSIIHVADLSKKFRIYANPSGRLLEWASFGKRVCHEDFWALRDVCFDVRRGESLGIVGVNGSGKSTLLKILSGAMYPTAGVFDVRGRVLSLLELGTGLNPQLTGRQNVINSARLLAFEPAYAVDKMPQIEAFAELGEFFDRPIRIYSSGMMVRLAFSMFACFEPDIFVIDEALSVGDVFFQQKCVRRIEQMLANGTTMLFVSHDMELIRRLCGKALLLSHGKLVLQAEPEEVIGRYFSLVGAINKSQSSTDPPASRAAAPAAKAPLHSDELLQNNILPRARSRHGAGGIEIVAATFQNELDQHAMTVAQGRIATLRVLLRANKPIARPSTGLHLYDRLGNLVFAAGTTQLRIPIPAMQPADECALTIRLGFPIQPGEYTMSLECAESPTGDVDISTQEDAYEGLGPIAVHHSDAGFPQFYGMAQLPMEITVDC